MMRIAAIALFAVLFFVSVQAYREEVEPELSYAQGPFALWMEEVTKNATKSKVKAKKPKNHLWKKITKNIKKSTAKLLLKKAWKKKFKIFNRKHSKISLKNLTTVAVASVPFIGKAHQESITVVNSTNSSNFTNATNTTNSTNTTIAHAGVKINDTEVTLKKNIAMQRLRANTDETKEPIQINKTEEPTPEEETESDASAYSIRMAEEPAIEYSQGPFALWLAEQEELGYGPNAPIHKKAKHWIQDRVTDLRNRFKRNKGEEVHTVELDEDDSDPMAQMFMRLAHHVQENANNGGFHPWMMQ